MNSFRRKERGLSILELAVVLTLMVSIVSAAVMWYSSINQGRKADEFVAGFAEIRDNTRRIWMRTARYEVDAAEVAGMGEALYESDATPKVFLNEADVGTSKMTHKLHSGANSPRIFVVSYDWGCAGCRDAFRARAANIDPDYCARVLRGLGGLDPLRIEIGNNAGAVNQYDQPLDYAAMTADCEGRASPALGVVFE